MGEVLSKFKSKFSSYTLVSDRGGKFEVSVDGHLLYSKLDTGEFPNNKAILKMLDGHLTAKK